MLTNISALTRRKVSLLAVVAATLSLTLSGCWDEENPTIPPPQNIAQVVTSGQQFTLLEAAITRANLGSTLSGTGPFTVFAPTDDAFRRAGLGDIAAINAANVATLTSILLYHVASGSIPASAIAAGQTAVPTSVSGSAPIYVTKASSGSVSVNNARVVTADVQATNGVIHVIDRVLLPPAGNILALASNDPQLSLLAAAAVRGGAAVTGALGGTTPLTVFAPTNDAFVAAGFRDVAAINAANIATLTAILTNHVVANARVFSPTLASGPITTFGGGSLTVATGSGEDVTILSRGNGANASRVLSNGVISGNTLVQNRDINATNGVIHKIDRVLLP
ncbi:fasciclin domain-containing protein [Spirosoma montaniterrae]|uniref:Fasciclin n=1 Tax=Spirosoma montaniterrae TaxID=1178516 RepID=A0A1P9WWI3_9BACT|nr:fasciclin domain-containing protein [Spirosoma montaniterrae]AQG79690.1 fasciclin [Spirosoma montaniterrae]